MQNVVCCNHARVRSSAGKFTQSRSSQGAAVIANASWKGDSLHFAFRTVYCVHFMLCAVTFRGAALQQHWHASLSPGPLASNICKQSSYTYWRNVHHDF